jgi:hypothetical protein
MLVDTSVWIDHFRRGNDQMASVLGAAEVHCHPFVIGEIACGNLRKRRDILSLLKNLPEVPLADHGEVLHFVEAHRLMGTGIGWVDAHLLTAAALANSKLWTLDGKLAEVASRLGMSAP